MVAIMKTMAMAADATRTRNACRRNEIIGANSFSQRRFSLIAAWRDLSLEIITDLICLECIDSFEAIVLALDDNVIAVESNRFRRRRKWNGH